jgi:metallo-beta-lactamase family protein
MHIEFYGATSGITGSCHILRANGQLLLLDCGLLQGRREVEAGNREPFPFSPDEISAVVLSHGHIDHSGRIPLLVKQGYRGPIYAQNATADLCEILLEDSASLQERDAEYENKWRKRKKKPPIEPLYSLEDARNALANVVGMRYREKKEILPGISIRFQDAGHIMGSSSVEVWLNENGVQRKIVFSGDLGQYDTPILNDPAVIREADHVLIESTYGNRLHRDRQMTVDEIGEIIGQASHQRGNLLIPAFAVGRSQEILYFLGKYYDQWGLDRWQVFLDSPMAIRASKVYWDYPHLYDEEATHLRRNIDEMPSLKNIHFTTSVEESMALNNISSGAIIIAGSGMCTGGRIRHHFKQRIWDDRNTIIFTGYQARGTLGRILVDGARSIRMFNDDFAVNASIETLGGLSAHAGQSGLLDWIGAFEPPPRTLLVHGEPVAQDALAEKLWQAQKLRVEIPARGDSIVF